MTDNRNLEEKVNEFTHGLIDIQKAYSSKDVWMNLEKQSHFLIFSSFIENAWSINSGKQLYSFLGFYHLDITYKDQFNFINHQFRYYLEYFELSDILENEKVQSKYDIKDFFSKREYLQLEERELKKLHLVPKQSLTINMFWECFYKSYMEDFFASVYHTYYDTLLTDKIYKDEKRTIINTLSHLYVVLGDSFEINEDMFQKKQKVSYMEFIISYYYIGFIDIESIGRNTSDGGELYISYSIKIQESLKKILDEIEEKRELILDKVFDDKYNEITIKKKNGELNLLESSFDVLGDDTKFVELKKAYPYSKIETDVHDGNINKYKLKEKIKLSGDKE